MVVIVRDEWEYDTPTSPTPASPVVWKDQYNDLTRDEEIVIRTSALRDNVYVAAVKEIASEGKTNALRMLAFTGREFDVALKELAEENNAKGVETIATALAAFPGHETKLQWAFTLAAAKNSVDAMRTLVNSTTIETLSNAAEAAGVTGATEALRFTVNRATELTNGKRDGNARKFFSDTLRNAYNKAVQGGHMQTSALALRALLGTPLDSRPSPAP